MTPSGKAAPKKRKSPKTSSHKQANRPGELLAVPLAKGGVKGQPQKKEAIAKDLAKELRAMRSDFQQAIEKLSLRIEGRIANLADTFDGTDGATRRIPSAKVSESLRQLLHRFKTKPEKGRLKDILTVCRLIKHFESVLPPEK